jgi:hypothetical protein
MVWTIGRWIIAADPQTGVPRCNRGPSRANRVVRSLIAAEFAERRNDVHSSDIRSRGNGDLNVDNLASTIGGSYWTIASNPGLPHLTRCTVLIPRGDEPPAARKSFPKAPQSNTLS